MLRRLRDRKYMLVVFCFTCAAISSLGKFKDQVYEFEQRSRYPGTYGHELFYNVSSSTDVFIYSAYFEEKYGPAFILCNITRGFPPPSLTISTGTNFKDVSNDIQVKTVPTNHGFISRDFTACVSPLHSGFSDSQQLIEWIEMHQLFGVYKFVVYVNSCSEQVISILEIYRKEGIVDIVQWPVPLDMCTNEQSIHYCGQTGAINDCLYRVKGHSRYISATDLDEFIVPQRKAQKTWTEMLNTLEPSDTYIFRCAYFFVNESALKMHGFRTQNIIEQDDYVFEAKKRSKYISVTDNVITMGVHFPITSIGRTLNVDPAQVLLHHYRRLDLKGGKPRHDVTVQNRVMTKYGISLQNAMLLAYGKRKPV